MEDPALEVIYINASVKVMSANEIIKKDSMKRNKKLIELRIETWGYSTFT